MNRNIFKYAILFVSINTVLATEERSLFDMVSEKFNVSCQRLKELVQGTIDEITQQKATELKQEILAHLKDDPYYAKAIEQNPDDLISWIILKGYVLPKQTIKTAYSHYLSDEENTEFRHWQKAMSLANKELNEERKRAKNPPAA